MWENQVWENGTYDSTKNGHINNNYHDDYENYDDYCSRYEAHQYYDTDTDTNDNDNYNNINEYKNHDDSPREKFAGKHLCLIQANNNCCTWFPLQDSRETIEDIILECFHKPEQKTILKLFKDNEMIEDFKFLNISKNDLKSIYGLKSYIADKFLKYIKYTRIYIKLMYLFDLIQCKYEDKNIKQMNEYEIQEENKNDLIQTLNNIENNIKKLEIFILSSECIKNNNEFTILIYSHNDENSFELDLFTFDHISKFINK